MLYSRLGNSWAVVLSSGKLTSCCTVVRLKKMFYYRFLFVSHYLFLNKFILRSILTCYNYDNCYKQLWIVTNNYELLQTIMNCYKQLWIDSNNYELLQQFWIVTTNFELLQIMNIILILIHVKSTAELKFAFPHILCLFLFIKIIIPTIAYNC